MSHKEFPRNTPFVEDDTDEPQGFWLVESWRSVRNNTPQTPLDYMVATVLWTIVLCACLVAFCVSIQLILWIGQLLGV